MNWSMVVPDMVCAAAMTTRCDAEGAGVGGEEGRAVVWMLGVAGRVAVGGAVDGAAVEG